MSWNKLTELPLQWYDMHWLTSFKVDNNCLTGFTEDMGRMQGLRQFWFGMNEITRCAYVGLRDIRTLSSIFILPFNLVSTVQIRYDIVVS